MRTLNFDAAILIEPYANDPQSLMLERSGIPYVTIGRLPEREVPPPWIDLRSEETARMLLTHLEVTGATKIALMISNKPRTSTLETEQAYKQWCQERHQVPVIYFLDEAEAETAGYNATRALLETYPEMDGLLALVDTFASDAMRALNEAGIAIPERMRVATRYDGIRARESSPPLTAVDMHLDSVASSAISLLFNTLLFDRLEDNQQKHQCVEKLDQVARESSSSKGG